MQVFHGRFRLILNFKLEYRFRIVLKMYTATVMSNRLLLDARALCKKGQVRRDRTAVLPSICSSPCGYGRAAVSPNGLCYSRTRIRDMGRYRAQLYSDSYDDDAEEKIDRKADGGVDKNALDGAYNNIFAAQEEFEKEKQKEGNEYDFIGQSREDVQV